MSGLGKDLVVSPTPVDPETYPGHATSRYRAGHVDDELKQPTVIAVLYMREDCVSGVSDLVRLGVAKRFAVQELADASWRGDRFMSSIRSCSKYHGLRRRVRLAPTPWISAGAAEEPARLTG